MAGHLFPGLITETFEVGYLQGGKMDFEIPLGKLFKYSLVTSYFNFPGIPKKR